MTRISKYQGMTKDELLKVVSTINKDLFKGELDMNEYVDQEHHEIIERLIVLEGDLYQLHEDEVRDIKKVFDELTGMLDTGKTSVEDNR